MSPAIITLLVLVVAIIIFVSDRLPMGLVAFMVQWHFILPVLSMLRIFLLQS